MEYTNKTSTNIEKPELIKVLITEDEFSNRLLLERLLIPAKGFESIVALNGFEAVDLFENQKFDLILMDVKMPKLDGIEATKRIRKIEKEKNIANPVKIIGITAHVVNDSRETCIEAGMDDVIFKPINLDEFKKLIFTVLKK
ncbi:MAG: two-component system, chemotaxis family, sensor kinase Cph1 [Bacteroidota bacterium]|nr:two-component system, chemotaxis family, sensor kinase Cph1 [Bacteroidota bacterium]